MSDEPDTERLFAFFRNGDDPLTEEGREAWAMVRDTAFPIPIVQGSNLPNWSMGMQLCDAGCHVAVYLIDEANGEAYLVQELPVFVAQATGVLDSDGNLNPAMQRTETIRRTSALN